jgi:hypothetical protein
VDRSAHVWSGRLAILASVPYDSRVLFHALFGWFFYGGFVTKMLLLTCKGHRAWVIPVAGGLVFFGLVYVWLTSELWFFEVKEVTF